MGVQVSTEVLRYGIGVIVVGAVMLLILRTDTEISRRAKLMGTVLCALLWPILLITMIVLIIYLFVRGIVKGFRQAEEAREEEENGPIDKRFS